MINVTMEIRPIEIRKITRHYNVTTEIRERWEKERHSNLWKEIEIRTPKEIRETKRRRKALWRHLDTIEIKGVEKERWGHYAN